MKPVQYFTPEYLELCKEMSTEEILEFLENFRILHGEKVEIGRSEKSRLISLKVPETLLAAFRTQARLHGIPYQTKIKKLMMEWVSPTEGD